jgi:hypothetical protein
MGAEDWLWNQLLDYIEEGLVIPVIGRELLWTNIAGELQYVPAHLAREFALRAGIEPVDSDDPVGAIVERYLCSFKDRTWPYTALTQLTRELDATPWPEVFSSLADLPFSIYVSTTADSYLERAVNAVRYGGRPETIVPAYGLESAADLPTGIDARQTVVFPLLGRANRSADFALTEEDVLEFVHTFQSAGTPKRLLETLRRSHLLIIGGGFSGWLLRFVIRLAKPGRLWSSSTGQLTHYVADRAVTRDAQLLSFLQHPLSGIRVFPINGQTHDFVRALHQRWFGRHPQSAGRVAPTFPRVDDAVARRGVFLSYCSEDYEAAERIRDLLDAAGLDVWFDKRDLNAGDEFHKRIRAEINKSHFFVVVISRSAFTPEPRFFRFEWREAERRAQFAPFDRPYVLPVVIDDTVAQDDRLPPFLRDVQWTRAQGGRLPAAFVRNLVDAYRQVQRPERY